MTAAGRKTIADLELGLRAQKVPESVIAAAVALVRSGIALAEQEAMTRPQATVTR